MPEISDATVEKLAAELAEKEGYAWNFDFTQPQKRWAKITGTPTIGDERRSEYLARAAAVVEQHRQRCLRGTTRPETLH